jgi:hypothetical protein
MFIRLTNSFGEKRGDPLLININNIVSVYEKHEDGGSLSTAVFSDTQLTWEVEESIKQVEDKINEALKKMKG